MGHHKISVWEGRKGVNKFREILFFCSPCQRNSTLQFSAHHSYLKACVLRFYSFHQLPRQSTVNLCKLALGRLAAVQMLAEALAQTQSVSFFFSLFSARHNSAAFQMTHLLLSKGKGVMNAFRREIMVWFSIVFLSG